jgi:hypothetical protein
VKATHPNPDRSPRLKTGSATAFQFSKDLFQLSTWQLRSEYGTQPDLRAALPASIAAVTLYRHLPNRLLPMRRNSGADAMRCKLNS